MWYNILLVDKRAHKDEPNWWARFNVCEKDNLEQIAKFYSHLYQRFRNYIVDQDNYTMFDLILVENPNHDPDCGTFTFSKINILPKFINKEMDYLLEHYNEFSKTWAKDGFISKKNKTLSFEDAARIVNKKYEKTFEYLKNN